MLAIAIFAGVLAAIYSSWTAVLRSSQVALAAAAEAQRSRMAVRALEEALLGAQMFSANVRHYAFLADTSREWASLSFVAHLPKSYPRGGKFEDQQQVIRRVTFTVESDGAGSSNLVLRQVPLLHEIDVDEEENPLVLARRVESFELQFWGPSSRDWETEWLNTNQLPSRVRFALLVGGPGGGTAPPTMRVVNIPTGNLLSGMPVSAGAPAPGVTNVPGPIDSRGGLRGPADSSRRPDRGGTTPRRP
jgi:type II secretory pathway component PulJ